VHNRIESDWNRIEAKLIWNRVELVPNQEPIEIESNLNRIGSNRTSPPGDFLFQFDSSHIIRVWYNNTSQEVQIESNRIELEANRCLSLSDRAHLLGATLVAPLRWHTNEFWKKILKVDIHTLYFTPTFVVANLAYNYNLCFMKRKYITYLLYSVVS
jgi:hypothetical protein